MCFYVGYYYYDFLLRVVNYVLKFDIEEKWFKWEYFFLEWFIVRMCVFFGEEVEEFFRVLNEIFLMSIRVNCFRMSVEEVENYLRKKGVCFERSERVNIVIRIFDFFNFEWFFNKGYVIV